MSVTLHVNPWPGGLTVPWAHYISKSGNAGMGGAFSHETGNQVTMTFQVRFTDLEDAIIQLLGYNRFNRTTLKLERQLPAPHPYLSWLRASRITGATPLAWTDRIAGSGGEYSEYQIWLLTVLFTMPRYAMFSDADLLAKYSGAEQYRFVTVESQHSGETINRPGGQFTYAEGGAGITGTIVNVPVTQFLAKRDMVIKWWNLPRAGAFDNTGQNWSSTYQQGVVSKINDADFMGFKTGTLLLRGFRFVEHEAPYSAQVAGLPVGLPPLEYDLEMTVSHWDPPYYDAAHRGHNLIPRSGSDVWFLATSDGSATLDKGLFRTATFSNLFLLNS